MAKKSPFDYVKQINTKSEYSYDLGGYVPFLTSRAFAMHMDTIMVAEQMNQYHKLSPELQYDFYFNAVRKGRRFGFPPKVEHSPMHELVKEYYNYSDQKTKEALELLTEADLRAIMIQSDKGGNT